jgi:hypothetical protein
VVACFFISFGVSAVGGSEEGRTESRDRAESGLLFKYFRYDGGDGGKKKPRRAEAEWGTYKRPGELIDDSLACRSLINRVEEVWEKKSGMSSR